MSTQDQTARRTVARDDGWVLVPVLALLAIALGLGFALLALVDTQSQQTREQRDADTAQTLAEGAVAAATIVLASDQSAAAWPRSGACRSMTRRLGDTTGGTTLEDRIAAEMRRRFAGSSPDLDDIDVRRTSWSVDLCPAQGQATSATSWDQRADDRWTPAHLTRVVVPPAGLRGPDRTALWIRGAATVRGAPVGPAGRSRAVVSKVTQDAAPFQPPSGYAVGTGSLSTDLQSTLSSTLLNNESLVGGLLGSTLGTKALIGDSPARIGTRCGLLNSLTSLSSLCLSGTLSGVGSLTRGLGLGQLNTVLGIGNQATLGTWTMAPAEVLAAYRRDAQGSGVYRARTAGAGDVRTRSGARSAPDCLAGADAAPDAARVVFLEQVGDGEQYCTVSGGSARILVVARGGVRITGTFTGVVYAANLQECTGADGSCAPSDRTGARDREVVRIDGGRVVGSVWADGSGGQVGIYPPGLAAPTTGGLLGLGSSGVCGLPVLGPLLGSLTTTLTGVLNVVGSLLGGIAGSQEQVRYLDARGNVLPTPPSNCDVLKGTLGTLSPGALLDLYGDGGRVSTVLTERRTRSCLLFCGAWSAWTPRDTVRYDLPSLLGSAGPSALGDVVGLLTATLSRYQAITYDGAVTADATTAITSGAAPVVGTYRNVPPAGR